MLPFNNKEIFTTEAVSGPRGGYDVRNEYFCARCVIIEIDVVNNAVWMQLFRSPDGTEGKAEWERELYLPPQHRTVSRQGIYGCRFRANSLEAPTPRITIEFIGEDEAWPTLGQIVG